MVDIVSMKDAKEEYELLLQENNDDHKKLRKLINNKHDIIQRMYIEFKIGFSFTRSYNNIIRDIEIKSKEHDFEDLSRSIKLYSFRLKFDDKNIIINDLMELKRNVYLFYKRLKLDEEAFYDQFLRTHRDQSITLYRGLRSSPVYNPQNWNIGNKIAQIVPMSTSINIGAPLEFATGADEGQSEILMVLSVNVDENFFALASDRRPYNVSKSDMYTDVLSQYEVTLPPGSFTIKGKDTINDIVIIFAKYEIYTYDEWKHIFDTVVSDYSL